MGEDPDQMWQEWNPIPGDFAWHCARCRGRAQMWLAGDDKGSNDWAGFALATIWIIESLTGQVRLSRHFRRPVQAMAGEAPPVG